MSFFVLTRSGARIPFDLGMLEQSLTLAANEAGEQDAFAIRSLAEKAAEAVLPLFDAREEVPATDIQAQVMSALRANDRSAIALAYEHQHAAGPAPEAPVAPATAPRPEPIAPAKASGPVPLATLLPPVPAAPLVSTVGEVHAPRRRRLSEERRAVTHKFRVGDQEGYITVGLYDDGQPGEIFLRMSKEGSLLGGLMDCFATAISLGLQYGVPLKVLARKFTGVQFAPKGETENPNIPSAESIVDYVFRWLAGKFLTPEERQAIHEELESGAASLAATPSVEEHIGRLSL